MEENKGNQLGVKSIDYRSQEAKHMLEKLNKLSVRGRNNKDYDFINLSSLRELFRKIYYGEILIPGAEREQNNFDHTIRILKAYKPRKDYKYYKLKQDLLINAQNLYDGRDMIIEAFKNKKFPLSKSHYYYEYVSEEDISPKSSISIDSEDELLKQYDELDKAISNADNKLDS